MKRLYSVLTLVLLMCSSAMAQSELLPKIMVLPSRAKGEDLRSIIEGDLNKRIALTKIKEAFDNRGYSTIDFIAHLNTFAERDIFTANNQDDMRAQVIESSGADIYVVAEINIQESSSGNSVNLILTAHDASTSASLANKIGDSGKFYTTDYGKLSSKAVESCADEFMTTINGKFQDMVNNGRSITLTFGFSEGSNHSMFSEVGKDGYQLMDEIELWMDANAYKNIYHIKGTSETQMLFDDVRIPYRDPQTGGAYSQNKFLLNLVKFARSLGLSIHRETRGTAIYITFQ